MTPSSPRADSSKATVAAAAETQAVVDLRKVENNAFQVGEHFRYLVRYGPIKAGSATLAVRDIVTINGRPCYHLYSDLRSNSFFSKFYKVEDEAQSYADVEGLFSWRFHKKQQEGDWSGEFSVDFDQHQNLAMMLKEGKRDTMGVPPFVQDMLSAAFYLRTMTFAPGDSILMDTHSDNKVYPLKILVNRRERIRVRAGKFDCLLVEPVLRRAAIYNQKGRIFMHLTDDHRKIPVQITTQLYVSAFNLGSIVAELEEIKGVPGFE